MPSSNPRYRSHKRRESLRAYILATQDRCGICGQPVDKSLGKVYADDGTYKWHPLSPVVDEIIPISKGGSPYDRDNCQLAHRICNARKGARMPVRGARADAPPRGGVETSQDW